MATLVHKRGQGPAKEGEAAASAVYVDEIPVPLSPSTTLHDELVDPSLDLLAETVLAYLFWSIFTEHIPTVRLHICVSLPSCPPPYCSCE